MTEAQVPRLEVPAITAEALEKGARLAEWLDSLRRLPKGVRIMASNCVLFYLESGYSEDEGIQCGVIIPDAPLPVTRIAWDYRDKSGRRNDTAEILPPTTDPVIIGSFELGEDFTFAQNEAGIVPVMARSLNWVPVGSSVEEIQLHEVYDFDPTAHRLAVIDNWQDPRLLS